MEIMAKKPLPNPDDSERTSSGHRYPGFMLRLHTKIRQQLRKMADRNATNESDEIRTAVREYLERNHLWPPPADSE
jgi:hypothetical protein